MNKTPYILILIGIFCLGGCQDRKKIEELENKFSLLEKENAEVVKKNAEVENEYEALKAERDSLQHVNEINYLSHAIEEKQQIQTSPKTSQSNLISLGEVDLFELDENNNIVQVYWYDIPYGPGFDWGLYLNRTGGMDSYELHVGRSKYHVSIGKFRLSANNGYYEFSAHAGKYYFDI